MSDQTILFVDDELGVLRALKRLLRKESVTVMTASNANEGLNILAQNVVGVVVSDQRMPAMCGTDFLKQVKAMYPHTVRCILSGYAEMDSVVAAINDGYVYRFIAKPWDDTELVAIITECLTLANEIAKGHRDRISLENKATELEAKSAQFSEQLELQESLLKSSRDVLDQLPVAVAALDGHGRMIYANRRFTSDFGHLPGATLGQFAGEPWASATNDNMVGEKQLKIDQKLHGAQIDRVRIGGHLHTLIAMSPASN